MIAEGVPQQEVFHRIVDSVGLLGFDRVCLEMLSEDGTFLKPVAGHGFPLNGLGPPGPASQDSDLKQLRLSPCPQVFSVDSEDPEEPTYKRGCVPVLLEREVVGKLWVDNSRSGNPLNQDRLQDAFHFAQQAVLVRAVHQNGSGSPVITDQDEGFTGTKLSEDSQLSAESLETLRKTTLAITSMLGRDELLKIIVERSVKLLKAKSGGLYEYRPELQDLTLRAEYNRPENIGEILKLGEGMAGRLIGTVKTHMVIADYHASEWEAPIYEGKRIFGAVLVVPLRWETREIGVLYVDDEVGREFSEAEILLLRLFADQAAISLINSDLLERDERQLRRLEQLAEATREMMGNLDKISLRGRLDLIARQATEILNSETAGVFLVREEELVLEASCGHVGIFTPGELKLKIIDEPGSGLTGAIAARGEVYCKNGKDLLSDPAYAGQISSHTRSGKCYSLLAIPLLKKVGNGGKSLVGLLRADNKKGRDSEALPTLEFTPEDVSILSIFAEAAVVAIESAELMEFRRGLIASSPNGIVAIDRQGKITELNRRAGEILGYDQDDVPRLTVYDLYMDREEPKRIGELLRDAADHQLRDYDTSLRNSSNEPIPVRHASALLLDENRRRVGSVGYFEDLRRENLWLEASTVLARAEKLDEGLQQLAKMTASRLGRSFCGILLMEDEEAESLVLRAEFLQGDPGWTPQRQRIFLTEWKGFPKLLREGKPWVRDRSHPQAVPMLKEISRRFGLTREIEVLLAVPLKIGDRIVGQLDLGDLEGEGRRAFSAQEIGLVSALASQITVLIDRFQLLETKERYFVQLATLHRISEHIQGAEELEQILHPVLTGVTARYGLAFNRAVLMLVDEAGESLAGAMGIGQLETQKAHEIWESGDLSGGLDAFDTYLRLLQAGKIEPTIVQVRTRELRLLIGGEDVFSEVVREGKLRKIETTELHRLPQVFCKTFWVTTPVAVAPLVTQDRVIGVLVVDNKFTQAHIGDELCEALMTFASTAAGAIERKRLLDQIRSDRSKLQSFFELSGELVPLQKPSEILKRIVAQAQATAGASWVTILLIDKAGRARNPLTSGVQIRPDGISKNVMKTGRAEYIENAKAEVHRINARLIEKGYQAAICLPLSLTGRRIGVMWLHYDQPRRFPESEVAALQLYGGQAAVAYESARRIETLVEMREASTALAEAESFVDVAQRIVEFARQVFKANAAMLWPFDAEQKQFIPALSTYSGDHRAAWHDLRQAVPRNWGTASHIMASGWMPVEDVNDPELGERVGDTIRWFLFKTDCRSFQGLALQVGRDMLGVLYVIYKSSSSFDDEEDKETAFAFATRAALALKKAKLLGQVQRAQEAAQAVARITLLEEPGKTIDSIAHEIANALNCGALVIFRYDEDTKTLVHPPAMVGVIEPGRAARLDDRSGDSLVLAMLEQDVPYPVEDVTRDEKFKNRRFARDEGVKSCIAIPLKAAGRKVGVLFVNYRNPHRFTDDDELTRMQLFANQAAVAIRNAQLFAESDTKLKQQEQLSNLSKKLLSARSVQETLDMAAEFAAAALGTGLCNIVLPDDEGRLIFSAGYGWKRNLIGRFVLRPGLGSQTGYTIQEKQPVAVYDYRQAEFDVPRIVSHYGIRSGLSVPMFRSEEIVGAMLVHARRPRHFNREDETLLSLIANQTAIALERAQQYEASFRKSAYLEALEKASRAIAESFGVETPSIGEMIEEIAKPSMSTIVNLRGPGAVGAVLVYDEKDESLVFQTLHAPDRYGQLKPFVHERRYIRKLQQEGSKVGVTGRAWLTGRSQLVRDVKRDPDYDEYLKTTRSELAVPILDRDSNKVLGVLNVESDRIAALDEEDQKTLEALAELVVLAIQNARQFSELREAKLLVNARTTLAWMGISNAVRRHEMSNYVGIIRSDLSLLSKELKRLKIANEQISRTLDRIERMARAAAKMDRSLSGRVDAKRRFFINKDLILSWNRRFKPGKLDPPVQLRLRCELPDIATASANVFWLKQVLDILVNNAVEATGQMSERIIVLGSRRKDSRAEVYVSDNGPGIPEPVRRRLFREPIEKPKGAKGLGMGLLVAHAIVQIYDGSMYIDDMSGGTTLAISLPLERGA